MGSNLFFYDRADRTAVAVQESRLHLEKRSDDTPKQLPMVARVERLNWFKRQSAQILGDVFGTQLVDLPCAPAEAAECIRSWKTPARALYIVNKRTGRERSSSFPPTGVDTELWVQIPQARRSLLLTIASGDREVASQFWI